MADERGSDGPDKLDDATGLEEENEELPEAESLFMGLFEYFEEWVASSPDRDLIGAEDAVLRFAAFITLMLMHEAVDDPGNAGVGLSREEMAKQWISDMCRDFAGMLMSQDMISATAEVIDKPDLRLHFDRAFRRRMFTA